MALTDIPILSMLRTQMQWRQARQRVLAENVANADTPGFRPSDLAPLKFDKNQVQELGTVTMARTDPLHLAGDTTGSADGFKVDRHNGFEVHPTGNSVSLEQQMMKVAANQMDFQEAATLYAKSLALIKTALGKA